MFNSKLSSFSSDGALLAICSSGEVLKIWNTTSGIFEHEFHPGDILSSSITCLKFSPKANKEVFKIKKKKHDTQLSKDPSDAIIALGTGEGKILIYSITKQKVLNILSHSSATIKDLFWQSENILLSLGNNKLILWDTVKYEQLRHFKVGGNHSCCALSKNQFAIASTTIHILKFDLQKPKLKEHFFSGHKSDINLLVPVFLNSKTEADYFLSVAQSDRYFYAWSPNPEFNEPVASFSARDIIITLNCIEMGNSSIGVVITTGKGHLKLFLHHLNGSSDTEPCKCVGSLKIKSKKNDALAILDAKFLSTQKIVFTYGTELFPHCENIAVNSLEGDLCWTRKDPSTFTVNKETTLVKDVTPSIPYDATYLIPNQIPSAEVIKESYTKRKRGEAVDNIPMEERMDATSLTQAISAASSGRPLNNYVHLLVQGLHSKDSTLMNSILSKGEDEEVINNTVRRLPVLSVVPFLIYLQEVVTGKGLKNLTCINWIKSLLYHHMSYLSSVPDKEKLFEPFYSIFAARAASLIAVTKLQSRISLLLTHVKNRHESVKQGTSDSHSEALVKYKEDSSDDEDRVGLEIDGAPSESEDIWDDWTEDEEDEADDIDDDETPNATKSSTAKSKSNKEKRKLSDDDDEIVVSGSSEECDSVDDDEEFVDTD